MEIWSMSDMGRRSLHKTRDIPCRYDTADGKCDNFCATITMQEGKEVKNRLNWR